MTSLVEQSELGKTSAYPAQYDPSLLFPIPRAQKRQEIGISDDALPFHGFDCWNHYEVSWLNPKGKPEVRQAEIFYDCHSKNIIESKSMKLYFNSLNQSTFATEKSLQASLELDLTAAVESPVHVVLQRLDSGNDDTDLFQNAICIDDLDIDCNQYSPAPEILCTTDMPSKEALCSHLLKSNCLVTGQPDWGSVYIAYQGPHINHDNLLRYIVSFRNHNEFHEQCIERIFQDLLTRCRPEELTVYGRYTRRGGCDINPFRSTRKNCSAGVNKRLLRQ